MKRILIIFLLLVLCFSLIACDTGVNHTGEAKTPSGSAVMKGTDYSRVVEIFEEKGFTNIKLEKIEDLITGWLTKDGEVEKVTVNGDENYSPDKWVDASVEVIIYYHTFPNKDNGSSSTNISSTTTNQPPNGEETIILTKDNCSELASLLLLRDPSDPSVPSFVEKYKGQTIEFDGCVLAINYHNNYTTRYDILIGAGDFNENSSLGPNFRLTDVNANDMGLNTLDVKDVLSTGKNIRIIAKVVKYSSNTSLFELDVISITVK